jgi:AraC-like DNA-binding protein
MKDIYRVQSVKQVHDIFKLEKPKHPLITVFTHENLIQQREHINVTFAIDLYQITLKECNPGSFGYGRNQYDFEEGTMMFTKPGQVLTMDEWEEGDYVNGWSLMFHPDLIRKSELGKNIDNYSFFSYDVNESLHLSDDEKKSVLELVNKIEKEYYQNIDKHSQKLIVSNIELILDYCTRYYDRQFYTRTNLNKDIVSKFESLLKEYYNKGKALEGGIPSVKFCGAELNMSSNYLSDLLKKETGRNAQEHIHYYIVDKAKTRLLNSTESISEIAYDLGFEYPQHFTKVFKKKTGMSPAAYRRMN